MADSLRSAGVGSGAMGSSSTLPGSGNAMVSHEFMGKGFESFHRGLALICG